MLEHRPRCDHQPSPARPAHQLDRHDAVATQREEVVVDANPLHPQHLGKQSAQQLLLRCARPAPDRGRQVGRRQRTPVELAVRRQRQTIQHHKRRRNHVLRKAAPNMRTQRRSIRNLLGARHHIRHQTPAAAIILARNHRRLRNARMTPKHSLDLARLNAEARATSLGCRHAPGSPEPRPHASAPDPRSGTSGSRGPPNGSATNRSPVRPARPT